MCVWGGCRGEAHVAAEVDIPDTESFVGHIWVEGVLREVGNPRGAWAADSQGHRLAALTHSSF